MDIKTVFGGTPFKIPVYVSYGGLSVKLNALVDTGVQCYLIINKEIANKMQKVL